MKKFLVIFFAAVLFLPLFADKRVVGEGNSYSEFSYIVMVGQIVEVTPFSVVFENTAYGTNTNDDKIKMLAAYFSRDTDFRSHGMANALRAASVKDGKMRLNFYVDNILKIFDDEVTTYMRYLPIYYLFQNNINDFKLPEKTMESLKKQSIDYYLSIPMVKDLMQNSWLAAVFTINQNTGKLTFKTGRFFDDIDELNQSDWAQEYRIPGIIRAGMTVSMTKAVFIGNESADKDKPSDESGDGKGAKSNKKQFEQSDNNKKMLYGTER